MITYTDCRQSRCRNDSYRREHVDRVQKWSRQGCFSKDNTYYTGQIRVYKSVVFVSTTNITVMLNDIHFAMISHHNHVGRSSFCYPGHQGRRKVAVLGFAIRCMHKPNQEWRVPVQLGHPRSLARPRGVVPTTEEAQFQESDQWILRRGYGFIGHIPTNPNAS